MGGLFMAAFMLLCLCLTPLLWVIYSKLLLHSSKSVKELLAEF